MMISFIIGSLSKLRLLVVPHLSSGILRARMKIIPRDTRRGERKTNFFFIFLSPHRVSPFSRGVIFTRATIPEEKWGTTRSLEQN